MKDLPRTEFGTGFGVTGADLTPNQQARRTCFTVPTIPTTGTAVWLVCAECDGTVVGGRLVFTNGVPASGTNFVQFSAINLGQNGAGTTTPLAAPSATVNTSQNAGITANSSFRLLGNASGPQTQVVNGDVIQMTATVTGTLPNTLVGGQMLLTIFAT